MTNEEAVICLVILQARDDAVLFFEEFGVPLDPASTDWDGVAWSQFLQDHRDEILPPAAEILWPIYQRNLINKTHQLAGLH